MSAAAPDASETPKPKAAELADLGAWWARASAATPTLASLQQRTRRVRKLKRLLPLIALLLIVAAFLWPAVRTSLSTRTITEALTPELAMLNLNYAGVDQNGRPFNVLADKATRQAPPPGTAAPATKDQPKTGIGIVDLTAPRAALTQEGGSSVNVTAQTGVYDETKQGLTLNGQVQLGNSQGVKVNAPTMAVDLKGGRAWTDQPVTATGDFGVIHGQGLQVEDHGERIIFTGKSQAVLNGGKAAAATDAPASATAQPASDPAGGPTGNQTGNQTGAATGTSAP